MNASKTFQRFLDFFLFTNIFLAASVTSLVFETSYLLTVKISDWSYPAFLFSATLFLYCFHRIYPFRKEESRSPLAIRHLWIKKNFSLFYLILIASALCTIYLLIFSIPFRVVVSLLPIAFISLGYTIPFIPWKGKWIRFRDIPGIKIFLISLVLSLTTVLLPVMAFSRLTSLIDPPFLFIFIRRFFFIFAITIPFDIRDMDYDRKKGTSTIPLILGTFRAKQLSFLALGLFVVATLTQYFWLQDISKAYLMALCISALVSGGVIRYADFKRRDYYYGFYLEGMMLLQSLLIIAGNKLLT